MKKLFYQEIKVEVMANDWNEADGEALAYISATMNSLIADRVACQDGIEREKGVWSMTYTYSLTSMEYERYVKNGKRIPDYMKTKII